MKFHHKLRTGTSGGRLSTAGSEALFVWWRRNSAWFTDNDVCVQHLSCCCWRSHSTSINFIALTHADTAQFMAVHLVPSCLVISAIAHRETQMQRSKVMVVSYGLMFQVYGRINSTVWKFCHICQSSDWTHCTLVHHTNRVLHPYTLIG